MHASVSEMTLHASVFRVIENQHLDPNIRNFVVYYRGFTTAIEFLYPTLVYEGD